MSENERPALVRRSSSFGRYGGGGEKCALCAKTVYVAERAVAQDKIFHVACFRCKECNVKLTLSSWCMDPCGGLWCKPHFMQALKTSGGTLTVNTESERSPPSTPRRSDSSNGKAAATPQRPLAPATAHGETRSPAHVSSPAPTPGPAPVCTPVPAPATASPAPRSGSKIMRSSSFGRFGGGGEKCTRCNKTVYAAERVSAKDQVFHNTCFRCIECNIKLSPSNWCMDLSGGVYCKPHFMQTMRAGGGKYDFGTGGSSSSLLSSAAATEPAAPEPAAQAPERAASGDGAASGAAARARPATPTSKSSAPPNGSPKPAASFRSRSGASSPTKQSPKSRRSRGRSKDFDKSPLPSPSMYRGAKPPPWAPNGAGAAAVGDTTNGTGSPHTPRELTRELSVSCDASEASETPIERPRSPSFAAAAAAAARVTGAVVGSGTIAIRHKARRSEQRPQKRNPEAAKPPAAAPASAPPDTLPLPDAWPPLVLLGVCGSLRAASTNAGLLRVAAVAARQRGVELRLATIGDLPLYSQDLDEAGGSTRGAVSSWRAAVSSADAVLFASPEHNYSISAALKNAIDWASRVPTQGNLWAGKAGAILSSGGGGGGVRGQQALRQIGSFIDVTFVNAPEVAIRRFEEPCFDAATGDLLPDSRWVGRVGELVERLVTLALALRASRPAPPRQDKAV